MCDMAFILYVYTSSHAQEGCAPHVVGSLMLMVKLSQLVQVKSELLNCGMIKVSPRDCVDTVTHYCPCLGHVAFELVSDNMVH